MRGVAYFSTKMQSYRRARIGLLHTAGIPLIVLGVLILVALFVRFVFPHAFFNALTPLFSAGTSAATVLGEVIPATSENLEAQVATLTADNERLRNENALLTSRLPLQTERGIDAVVLARPPLTPYDVLIVSAGSVSGVHEGAVVFAQGVPVGTVADTTETTARVLLYSSAERGSEGWVGDAQVPILLVGRGAGAFTAEVPRDAGIAEGDLVYLVGAGSLSIGSVARLEESPSSPSTRLYIRAIANPFSMMRVYIAP